MNMATTTVHGFRTYIMEQGGGILPTGAIKNQQTSASV